MPQRSPFQIDIPATDILTYLFPPHAEPSDQPIWIDAEVPERALSPKQLLHWVKRLGLGLQNLDLRPGDVVMVYSANHIFVPVAYTAIAGAGFIFSGTNPAYGVAETVYQIENTSAKAIFVEPTLLHVLLQAASKTDFPTDRIWLFSDIECQTTNSIKDWRTMLASSADAGNWHWRHLNAEQSRTTTAVLNYSSGTTGLPKGVMISHQNVIANVVQSIHMRDLEQPYDPSNRPQERWLGFLPLYHAYGQLWSISAACKTLSPCYFMRTFSYERFLANIERHRVTHIQTAPPILVMLAKRPETARYDLSSLQNILCGAAPLSKELQNEVSARCGLKVVQTWGMTEVTCSSLHVPGGRDDRSGSVGFIDPNAEMKLITDEGKEAKVGERGEIHVRGPNVCLGYWRNGQATKETFDEEGFLRTGDVAIRNEEGWYWIVDRKKELIKVKGFQVAPAELEAVLLENENIGDAAVVALHHGELPRAYVVLKEAAKGKVSENDIVSWTAKRVARHKQLLGGVMFVDEVPKSPSGKIQRKIMKEWAARDAKEVTAAPIQAKL
ncbi:4-coumarate-CoA ligase [Saccharata proteae CBS 121410]|uniref:4-coumarate-CoA ligase n=1 Tax=Saccharata proteae CBS 121410 TaxID=1314787 RepID=A0A9P4LX54_9PEZI|nr:4-coumarate-CoA ligase [Saccharata proteae CBS 121410]